MQFEKVGFVTPFGFFMDANKFAEADPHLAEIGKLLERELAGPAFSDIGESLERVRKVFGTRYSVSLSLAVELCDDEGSRSLPLLATGIEAIAGIAPFRTSCDSSPQRYIVDGTLVVVPDDRCPKCWGTWDFKFHVQSCNHCDAQLSVNCKLVLARGVCPMCERGKVSESRPKCDSCGYVFNHQMVEWDRASALPDNQCR